METRPTRAIAVPARSLVELTQALREEVGPLAAIHGLHAAGYSAGEELFRWFRAGLPDDPRGLSDSGFWERMSRFFAEKGWGHLRHDPAHPGIGLLRSEDWAEADPGEGGQETACAFSSGLLASFLTQAAGGPVAVLAVTPRVEGDPDCTFCFGSEEAIRRLYGELLEGLPLDQALARV